jgi:hypothetical protein
MSAVPARSSQTDQHVTGSSATRTTVTIGRASEKNGSPEVQSYSTGYGRSRSDQQPHSSFRVRDPVLRLDETRTFYRDYKQYLRAKEKALKNSEVPAQQHQTTTKSGKPASKSVKSGAVTVKQKKSSGHQGGSIRAIETGGQGTGSRAKTLNYSTGYIPGGVAESGRNYVGDFDYTLRRGRIWKSK